MTVTTEKKTQVVKYSADERNNVVDAKVMDGITSGLKTKADKIRKLHAEPHFYTRVAIQKYMGISYQHVRNTLTQTPTNRKERKLL